MLILVALCLFGSFAESGAVRVGSRPSEVVEHNVRGEIAFGQDADRLTLGTQ